MKRFMLLLFFCTVCFQACDVIEIEREEPSRLTGDGNFGDLGEHPNPETETHLEDDVVEIERFHSQGTIDNPVVLSLVPDTIFEGEVSSGSSSYYRLNVVPNGTIQLRALGYEQPISVFAFSDEGFSLQPFCFATLSDSLEQSCLATSGAKSILYIEIESQTEQGTEFELSMAEVP